MRNPCQQLTGAERIQHVVSRRADRVSFREIGAELGISGARAHQLWVKALRQLPVQRLDEHRREALDLIDRANLLKIAEDDQISGRSRVEAWSSVKGWEERRARLLGLDAPARARVNVITRALESQAPERVRLAARIS